MVVVNRGNGVVVVEFALPADRERWLCLRNWEKWQGMEVVYGRDDGGGWATRVVRMLSPEAAYGDVLRLLAILTSTNRCAGEPQARGEALELPDDEA